MSHLFNFFIKVIILGDFHMGTPPLHCANFEVLTLDMVADDLDGILVPVVFPVYSLDLLSLSIMILLIFPSGCTDLSIEAQIYAP